MLSLAEELKRGPKLQADPELRRGEKAREMYARGYTRRDIAKRMGVNHAKVTKWVAMRKF